MIDRRHLVLGSILAASGLAAFAVKPGAPRADTPAPDLDALMPATVGQWSAGTAEAIILANADELGDSAYDALAARHYQSAGRPAVTVLIAYGQAQSYATQLHRPELCYPASGFTILDRSAKVLPLAGRAVPAQMLVARRQERTDDILYWARIGESFPESLWDQRLAIARSALAAGPQDGLLARYSVSNPPEGEGEKVLTDFVRRFLAAQDEAGRALLIGRRRENRSMALSHIDNMRRSRSG